MISFFTSDIIEPQVKKIISIKSPDSECNVNSITTTKSVMKILVTGATGYVGSVLIPELIKKFGSKNISAFVLPNDKIPESWKNQRIRVFYGDITDKNLVWEACEGHTHVIHLAGLISYWRADVDQLMKVNRDGVSCIVEACLGCNIHKLIHISSVGAIGFDKNGRLTEETMPFNWPPYFYYMHSKYKGQQIVENAVKKKGLQALILNPASIMGPGDPDIRSPHNQLYHTIYKKNLFGSFSGGLAIVDVRDLVAIIIKSFECQKIGEKYLIVGANMTYQEVIKLIGKYARRKVYPFRLPSFLFSVAGLFFEFLSDFNRKKPLLTYAYGRLSGWKIYYSNKKSQREFSHTYMSIEKTIRDSCAYFENVFL